MIRVLMILSMLGLLLAPAGVMAGEHGGVLRYSKNQTLSDYRPGKPVKIKLKRTLDGNYSWELSGDDTNKVIEVDKELREYIKGK